MLRTLEDQYIQRLYNKRAKNDENSSTLAQTLESNIFTAFKGEHKFIFELLQNADDSNHTEEEIETSLILKEGASNGRQYLIFSHSGKHFSEQDVEKICDNGQQYSQDKSLDPRKIGYKGIGFKAVFSIADCVHIMSVGYNFRFDEDYFLQMKEGKKSYPWPIIPISNQASDLLPELRSVIKKDQVTFILQIRPKINIKNEIQFIKENRTLMLFLRNVRTIKLKTDAETTEIRVEQADLQHKNFFINGTFMDGWVIKEFIFDIPGSICQFLNTLQDSECPKRLKVAKKTKIIFAAQIDSNHNIIPNLKSQLFCYLPTQVNCGFPYTINADFLLNTERTRLVDNLWNEFLMMQIGYFQLCFLAELNKNQVYQTQIFKLLPEKAAFGLSSTVEKGYISGFEQAIDKVPFIPSLRDPNRLLKVSDAVVDRTEFYCRIVDFDFSDGKLISNNQEALDRFLAVFRNKIKRLIQFSDLINDLPMLTQTNLNIKTQCYVLNFLNEYIEYNDSALFQSSQLKNKKFILSNKNQLLSPSELYLSAPSLLEISEFNDLDLVHPKLFKFKTLLSKIGVRSATRLEFIRHIVKQLILGNKISLEKVISITRLVFEAMRVKELKEEDWEYLKKLPIKTQEGSLRNGFQCYLADHYRPNQSLEEALIEADIFISVEYPQQNDDIELWKEFFKKIGVKNDIEIHYYPRIQLGKALVEKPFMKDYLNFIRQEGSNPQELHYIENFVDIDLIDYASFPGFSDIFWKELIGAWSMIVKHSKTVCYKTNKYTNSIKTTYLQFCISQLTTIFSNFSQYYSVHQVFMPALDKVIGNAFPVAKINVQLTEEQAAFFGFKTSLSVEDCLHILDHINSVETKKESIHYTRVLRYLLNLSISDVDAKKIKTWQGYLLSQNNILKPVKLLQYSNLMIESPKGENWLKNFTDMNREEMIKIARLFAIPVLGEESVLIKAGEENSHSLLAKEKIFQRLPVIALMEAQHSNTDPISMLGELLEKFECLTFISVDSLSVVTGGYVKPVPAYLQADNLYFEKKYDYSLTKNEFCRMISIYFKLTSMSARALETFLFLDEQVELENFLIGKELEISQLPKINDIKYKSKKMKIEIPSSSHLELTDRLTAATKQLSKNIALQEDQEVGTKEMEFSPYSEEKNQTNFILGQSSQKPKQFVGNFEIEVDSINIKKVEFHQKHTIKFNPIPSSFKKTQQFNTSSELEEIIYQVDNKSYFDNPYVMDPMVNKIDNLKVGRLGERIVYEKLLSHYKIKYHDCKFQETKQGLKVVGKYLNEKTKNIEPLSLELIWHNKGLSTDQDNSTGSDLIIKKNGITRYIEVKASHLSKKNIFRITCHEWTVMKEVGDLYRIFKVSNVGSKNPNIIKIKNPFREIERGNLEIKAYELKI